MLNTQDIKTGGGGTPKTLQPGNQKVKINGISYQDDTFKPGGLRIFLHCEGEDLGTDFEGFFINKDNESLGRHKGQVANVRASEYSYADGVTKSGIQVSRDADILKLLLNICKETDCENWLKVDQHNKHQTIQSLLDAFNNDKPYKDKFLNVCLAAKEYMNKQGYTAYDLFLPKASKTGFAFEAADKKVSKVIVFSEADHIRKKAAAENVEGFGGASNDAIASDFKI